MCSGWPDRPARSWAWCLAFLLAWASSSPARTGGTPSALTLPPPTGGAEAWLVTVAPGALYWQRFGHNAIWLREPARGLDHTFNFGYFDFEQENFLARFVQGRMLYQSLAFPAAEEFAIYAREGRSIRAQRLDLGEAQYRRLRDHLVWHVQPANRDYTYDYYRDNCSTRIRDALDLALDGALHERLSAEPARLDFRAHTRRLTSMDYWYYLGLEAALGAPVDRPTSRWEEMFIPEVVADTVATAGQASGGRPLAALDTWVFEAGQPAPPASPPRTWPRYLLLGAALCLAAWLAARRRPAWGLWLARSWVGLNAMGGVVLLALWCCTDHAVARLNGNLLLLNPVFALLLVPRWGRAPLVVITLSAVAALWVGAVAQLQYMADTLALVVPLNLLSGWRLARQPRD